MIELLVSSLLPFMQFLEDPKLRYGETAQRIESRLRSIEATNGDEQPPLPLLVLSDKKIPPVSGRLLESSASLKEPEAMENQGRVSEQLLRLTGVIESDGQRVGIVSNGQQDMVVGVGSYLFGAFKVIEVGRSNLVMSRLEQGKKPSGPVTLKLNGESAAGVN